MNSSIIESRLQFSDEIWLQHFFMLLMKLSYLGVGSDLKSISIDAAWDLYCTLSRLEVSNGAKP